MSLAVYAPCITVVIIQEGFNLKAIQGYLITVVNFKTS